MPIPKPESAEKESEFISRCASQLVGEEGYEREQAVAICYQQLSINLAGDKSWRKSFMSSKTPSSWIKKH
jgi:hypothetical protein